MEETCVLRPIAHVHSEFPGKFGIPRQSGVVPELRSELIFTPEFRNPDALRGIELIMMISGREEATDINEGIWAMT